MGRIDVAAEANLSTGNGLVKLPDVQSVPSSTPAGDVLEIEEWADTYFFRPLGAPIARVAAALRLTPTQVTVFGGAVGVLGGCLLFDERLGLLAFALLIAHGIIDS